jgi:hypothetical protein
MIAKIGYDFHVLVILIDRLIDLLIDRCLTPTLAVFTCNKPIGLYIRMVEKSY